MKIIEINSKETLNNFIVQHGNSNFLQSWEWGEFQKSLGRKVWRPGVEHDGQLVASALVIKNNLPLSRSYLYCPRGPIFESSKFKVQSSKLSVWRQLLETIKKIAQKEKAIFWRFDWPNSDLPKFLGENKKLVKVPQDIQPRATLILNLDQSEAEILVQMKAKTRYNIGLAKRKGVIARQSVDQKDIDPFLKLIAATSRRDHFQAHPEIYYQKMVDFFGKRGLLKIFLAEYKDKVLAANLAFFWGKTATYLHGASSNEFRNLMASHLLQWEQILEAKKQGLSEYDFWGILEKVQSSKCKVQGWEGITRFKKGFGGKELSYAGTYDLILDNFWYKIYRLFKR